MDTDLQGTRLTWPANLLAAHLYFPLIVFNQGLKQVALFREFRGSLLHLGGNQLFIFSPDIILILKII